MRFILITLLVVSSLSCDSVSMSINTNLPLFNRSSFEIVNTSDYYLEVSVNGRKTNFKTDDGNIIGALPPAESASIFFWNWSSYSAEGALRSRLKTRKASSFMPRIKKSGFITITGKRKSGLSLMRLSGKMPTTGSEIPDRGSGL